MNARKNPHFTFLLYYIKYIMCLFCGFLRDLKDLWDVNSLVFCAIALGENGVCVLTFALTTSIGHLNKRVKFLDALVKL
jgi:hypothetical protein